MRILGIFSRLAGRDGKVRYLDFMPRMWGHLGRTLEHPALTDARAFVEEVARPYLEKAA
jgi:aminoglycoside/choline kinase family phosphotransferase